MEINTSWVFFHRLLPLFCSNDIFGFYSKYWKDKTNVSEIFKIWYLILNINYLKASNGFHSVSFAQDL